jgi:hypothetical protein
MGPWTSRCDSWRHPCCFDGVLTWQAACCFGASTGQWHCSWCLACSFCWISDARCSTFHRCRSALAAARAGAWHGAATCRMITSRWVLYGCAVLCCAVAPSSWLCCGSRVSRQLEHTLAALRPVLFADAACPACIDAATNITCLPPMPCRSMQSTQRDRSQLRAWVPALSTAPSAKTVGYL